jgi:heme/copper-type cytochrome/quinol oxidase subunit 2
VGFYSLEVGVNDTYGNLRTITFKIEIKPDKDQKRENTDLFLIIGLILIIFGTVIPFMVVLTFYYYHDKIKPKYVRLKNKLKEKINK